MLTLDHIAISAATLAEGVAHVEAALGVTLAGGGQHPNMATHNRLLGLGDLYLEVIAVDPAAARPPHPRWFDLDNFSGPPRLTNWVARSDDLTTDLNHAPAGTGTPLALSRGHGVNVAGFFDPLIALLDHMVAERFLRPEHRALALVDDDAARLVARFAEYQAPTVEKWLDRGAR